MTAFRRFPMKKGDTQPALQVQILNPDGSPRNITDDIIVFNMGIPGQARKINGGAVFKMTPTQGVCEYRWSVGDLNVANVEYRGTFVLNGTNTYPKDGYILIPVEDTV